MESRIDSAATPFSAGKGVHSSNAITMSASSSRWISIEDSGLSMCSEPSIWLRNRTPSSLIRRSLASDITWNPPESVRIGPSQFMNRCSPPRSATRCAPGRSIRW